LEEERELIERAKTGEHYAFNMLAKRYIDRIYWHAIRMLGNHADADEVTQEVLIVIYNKISKFNFESSLYTWIYKITTTRCLNYIKKRSIINFFSFDSFEDIGDNGCFENNLIEDIENKEKIKNIEKVLQTLPAKQRQVFILRHYDGLSYEEISEITGKKIGTLKANYFHALNKLIERVK
jgi:RNA polymerase sigma-70 factor (ECF subfamily)